MIFDSMLFRNLLITANVVAGTFVWPQQVTLRPTSNRVGSHGASEQTEYTKTEQGDELCVAGGRQWTGKIPVTKGNSLFYWYFESQSEPESAPLLMFLTGGPGEASQFPLLGGIGPCNINEHGNGTVYNKHSWTTEFNLLFVDEIAGAGFSKTKEGVPFNPTTLQEVTLDLKHFLKTFTEDTFPELAGRDFHVMGESFGGALAPVVAVALVDDSSSNGPKVNLTVQSLIASSTFIDIGYWSPSYFDTLCGRSEKYLNTTECAIMAAAVPECESEALKCRLSNSPDVCFQAMETCSAVVQFWWPPEHNIVKLGEPCTYFPTCGPKASITEKYLNTPRVQNLLGFKPGEEVNLLGVDMDINAAFSLKGSMFLPNTWRYKYLLDETNVKVVTLSGTMDPDTPIEGVRRSLDFLPWYGQAYYRVDEVKDWYFPSGDHMVRGGEIQGYDKLWFISFEGAGHTIHEDVQQASQYIMQNWLKGVVPVGISKNQLPTGHIASTNI